MNMPQLTLTLRTLEGAGIPVCLIGEIALNYYNVPRVVHDIEICVPGSLVKKTASLLHRTCLFEPEQVDNFDLYNEYKRGCPRLRATSLSSPSWALVILPDTSYRLDPLLENIVPRNMSPSRPAYSNQIMDIVPLAEVDRLPIPRLPALFAGLCHRFVEAQDDTAMIAAEQLVDGMDLDEDWCERNLRNATLQVRQLAKRLVLEKTSRLDEFSENTRTYFVANSEDAETLRRIPGYE